MQVTTTTVVERPTADDAFKGLIPDPWGLVRGIYRYVWEWSVDNWLFVVLLVLVGCGYMAWRTFKQAVWGH